MGTRADLYVGRGKEAEWLGSIAWDGYPDGIDPDIFAATTEDQYRALVLEYVSGREDGTLPKDGWPWPWNDSRTTDFAYAFDGGSVWACRFGYEWQRATEWNDEKDDQVSGEKTAEFPDMSARKKVKLSGPGSGLIVIGP